MTETLTEQPTAAALQSRLAQDLTFPEHVVRTRPGSFREGSMHNIYVVESPEEGPQENVGTIMSLEPAPSGNGWLNRNIGNGMFHRYYGALVSPTPVNGHYYRSLGTDQFLVRYNDDAHMSDRGQAGMPWTLLRGRGTATWPVPNDGLGGDLTAWPYVEVVFDESAAVIPAAEETAVRTAETEDATATIGNDETGPTRGMARVEADGTVLLDPEMVKGEMYLLWPADNEYQSEWGTTFLVAFVGDDPTRSLDFIPYGYYDWNRGRGQLRWTNDYYTLYSTEGMHWAKAALVKPEAAEDDAAVTVHEELLETEEAAFKEFNRKANAIARNAGWCEEYDRIVTSVGMKGRYKRFSFDLSVDITFTDNSPSSDTDRRVREQHGLDVSLSLNEITYTGSIDVTVTVETQPDRESAENWIDADVIEREISSATSGVSFEITDWTVTDWDSLDGDDDDEDED